MEADDIIFTDNDGNEQHRLKTDAVDVIYNVKELEAPSLSLINDVSKAIREDGFEFFEKSVTELGGTDFYFNIANTFEFNSSGWLGDLIDGESLTSYSVKSAFHIAEWTHSKIADGTKEKNALEHLIGTFLIFDRYGPLQSFGVTTANEVRGLYDDYRSGDFENAIKSRGGTAFEWSDLKNNLRGAIKYTKHMFSRPFKKENWKHWK